MPSPVKPKRKYQSRRRETQAEETRAAILSAAHVQFVQKGWTGTTIPAIAASAGVSNETIYASFGSKQAMLQKLIERAVRGGAPDLPLLEQNETRRVLGQQSAKELVGAFARQIAGILEQVAPLVGVLGTAAETNSGLSELYHSLHAGRRRNLTVVADTLARGKHLRTGLEAEQATDEIWRLASPELFMFLRHVEGLDREAYATWLTDSLARLLLIP